MRRKAGIKQQLEQIHGDTELLRKQVQSQPLKYNEAKQIEQRTSYLQQKMYTHIEAFLDASTTRSSPSWRRPRRTW